MGEHRLRWHSWVYIFLAEVASAALTALVGLLTNVVTNEQHIKTVVVVMLITFTLSSAVLQGVRYGIAEKRGREADEALRGMAETTKEILESQRDAHRDKARHRLDENLEPLPAIFRSWIKAQWEEASSDVDRILNALNDQSTTPSAVVLEWQQHLPDWLRSLDWRALLAAGELANAYGASDLSSDLFLVAIRAGATREHYWRSRAALLMKFQGQEQEARQTLIDGGVDTDTPDRFARIIYYFVVGDNRTTLAEIESWEPREPIDILWTGMVRSAALFAAAENPGAAEYIKTVVIYRNMVNAIPYSASAHLNLANALINTVLSGASLDRHSDLEEALAQAIRARDLSRESRSNSTSAVELACQAAYIDQSFGRVIEIGTAVTGEATVDEAGSDTVKTYVATAVLGTGLSEIGARLIPEIKDPFRRAYLLAASAEVTGRPSSSLWSNALQESRDVWERVQALLGLARTGTTDLPGIDEIRVASPRDATLIEAVAAEKAGNVSSAIRQLRTISATDFTAVGILAGVYLDVGDIPAAIDVLREAAQALNEPRLRLEAARLLWQDGKKQEANSELERLLIDSGSNTVIRHDCLVYLAQWAANQGDLVTAQTRFQDLLVLDPSDDLIRWSLIIVLLSRGLTVRARQVYQNAPREPIVTEPDHARAWMVIKVEGPLDDPAEFVVDIMNMADRFPDNEFVQAEAIFIILSPNTAGNVPLPSATQERFNAFCERFFNTWPDSSRMRRIGSEDIEQLRSQMDELIRPTQEEQTLRSQIADKLARNVLPWAFLSVITRRSYAEVMIVRGAGIIPANSIDSAEQQMCRDAVHAAIDKAVVLDISAGAVVIELQNLTDTFVGLFESVTVSETERLDINQAVTFLRGRHTSTWIYDEQSDRGRIAEVSQDVANQWYEKAARLLSLLGRCRVSPIVSSSRFSELGELASSPWATAIECSAQSGAAFWCDDIALRAVARSIGISAFSTPALLEVLVERGMLDPPQHENAMRTLIESYVGDFFLDGQRLTAVVEKLPGVVGPVASIFSRTTTWANVQHAYNVWCLLVRQILAKDKKQVADWVYAGVIGISRPQKGASLRREAAALLLSVAAMILSDTPDEVARCVVAARAALTVVRQEAGDDDPLGRAAQVLRSSMAQISDLIEATKYVSRVFSALGHEDREKILRALYE